MGAFATTKVSSSMEDKQGTHQLTMIHKFGFDGRQESHSYSIFAGTEYCLTGRGVESKDGGMYVALVARWTFNSKVRRRCGRRVCRHDVRLPAYFSKLASNISD